MKAYCSWTLEQKLCFYNPDEDVACWGLVWVKDQAIPYLQTFFSQKHRLYISHGTGVLHNWSQKLDAGGVRAARDREEQAITRLSHRKLTPWPKLTCAWEAGDSQEDVWKLQVTALPCLSSADTHILICSCHLGVEGKALLLSAKS